MSSLPRADNLDSRTPRRSLLDLLRGRAMLALTDQAVVSLATFSTLWLIGKVSKEQAGFYAMASAVWVLIGEAHNSLVSNPHMLRVPKLRGGRLTIFNGSTLAHQVTLSLLLATVAMLGAGIVWTAGYHEFAMILGIAGVTAIGSTLRNYARNFCFATRENVSALWLDLGVSVPQFLAIFALWYTGHLTAIAAVFVLAAANFLSALVWLLANRSRFAVRTIPTIVNLQRNWNVGRWLFASSMMWVVGLGFYPWVISGIRGVAEAGVYGVCAQLAALCNPPVTALQNYLGPAIAHAHDDRDPVSFRRFVIRATVLFTLAVIPFSILMAIFSEQLLGVLFHGGQYHGDGKVAGVLVFAIVCQAGSFAASRGLFCIGRAKLDTATNIVPITVLLTFGVWSVYAHGALGAAIALLVSQALGFCIRFSAFLKASRHPGTPVRDVAADERIVVLAGGEA